MNDSPAGALRKRFPRPLDRLVRCDACTASGQPTYACECCGGNVQAIISTELDAHAAWYKGYLLGILLGGGWGFAIARWLLQ